MTPWIGVLIVQLCLNTISPIVRKRTLHRPDIVLLVLKQSYKMRRRNWYPKVKQLSVA